MKKFCPKIRPRSKKAMVAYLSGHFRYNTMNSWNRSTSYANNMKIHRLDLTREQEDQALAMLEVRAVWDAINSLLDRWAYGYQYLWQAKFNGRSGGYLVLYGGELDYANAHTAECDACGKLTYHKQDTPCTSTGCAGILRVVKPIPQIKYYPGRPIDQCEDFRVWDVESLRDRVALVMSFDKLCDDIVAKFLDFCNRYKVEQKKVMVPKLVPVLVPV